MAGSDLSPFDALLARGRERLDALYRGTGGRERPAGAGAPRAPAPESRSPEAASGAAPAAGPRRFLDDRYGAAGWRFEVVDRRRDADEVVVLGRLTIPDRGLVKTRYGSATLGDGARVAGTAGGVGFSLAGPGPAATGDREGDAYRRAEEAALASCVELL